MNDATKRRIVTVSTLVILYVIMRISGIGRYFSLATIKAHRALLLEYTQSYFFLSSLAYTLLYTSIVGFSVPAAAPLTIIGGFLFGPLWATILVNIGATMGAAGIFLLVRYVTRNGQAAAHGGALARFKREIAENGQSYLLVLRLIPLFPFFLINIAAALAPVSFTTFVWTTSVGIIPGTFVYAFAGRQLAIIDRASDILSGPVLLAFALLSLLALIPVLYKRLR